MVEKDKSGHLHLKMPETGSFKILQLTDLHLGFGAFSASADKKVLAAADTLIEKAEADLIVLTGDMIYPFLPKSGTLDNGRQMKKLTAWLDQKQTPYTMIFGNHDEELGSKRSRAELADILSSGKNAVFEAGTTDISGVGNFIINIRDDARRLISSLLFLDTNMYGGGWFFSGFDCLHEDQIEWSMNEMAKLQQEKPDLNTHAFIHMPLAEYKKAYEMMKLGNKDVGYHFGSIGEKNDYFGISKFDCSFFDRAVKNGAVKAVYCGHDHYNTISMSYRGIRLTYGMSLDYHAYGGDIKKRYTQRGGTVIEIDDGGNFEISPLPLGPVVSTFVRGA